ncbi:MAG: flagellar protein G [Candidatus Thermoplasmatota archaeon]|nr:flagellar protein G [Candidatus Thermoplasmatota archaeon]MBU1941972.1 flagellar protein G [Candidatus Thermoplasmatota archaeon]
MGFSLSGAHVIFFIGAVVVAGTVSGIFIAITMNVSTSLSERGDRLQEQLDTEFKIINDPDNIPLSGDSNYRIFYLKNIGVSHIPTSNITFQLFIDGEIVSQANYNFTDTSIRPGEYTSIYILESVISAGDHTIRVVGPLAIYDEFTFEI